MEIKYANGRVQKPFSDYSVLIKTVGLEMTRAIKKRIDQIRAFENFQNWLKAQLGSPHQLRGNMRDYYGVSVTSNVRLILKPEADDYSLESLSKCTVIVVKGVCDYHGDKTNWIIQ
jgi:proteic killer suppression protein/toxin YoeB